MISDDLFNVLNKLYPAAFHDVEFEALYGNKKYKMWVLFKNKYLLNYLITAY